MNTIGKKLFLASAVCLSCASSLFAQSGSAFANGDMVLGFQAVSGDGNTKNIFFNLGSPITFRNGTNAASLGNIGTTLSDAYGSDWFDREDVRFGVIANLSDSDPGGFMAPGAVNGDPSATLYVSQPTATAGQGAILNVQAASALAFAGTRVSGMEVTVASLTAESNGARVLDQTVHLPGQWSTGWTAYNPPSPSPSFAIFSNIEQHLGQGGGTAMVDVQRILSTATGANPTGPVLRGEYIVTISIDSAGNVTALKAGGPATGTFATWATQNNVTGGPLGDSDNDGILNIVEYALDLNPQGADKSPGTLVNGTLSFPKRAVAVTNNDVTYAIETSDDLGITSPWTTVAATSNTATEITFALPTGKTKTFARLKVAAAN